MPTTEATSSVRSLQGKSAAARRWNKPDRAELARDYAAARVAAYVEKVLAEAPPLTDEQRATITRLLGGGPIV